MITLNTVNLNLKQNPVTSRNNKPAHCSNKQGLELPGCKHSLWFGSSTARPVKPYKDDIHNATIEHEIIPFKEFRVKDNVTVKQGINISSYNITAGDNFISEGDVKTEDGDIKLGNNAQLKELIEFEGQTGFMRKEVYAENGNVEIGNKLEASEVKAFENIKLGNNCKLLGKVSSYGGDVNVGNNLIAQSVYSANNIKLGDNAEMMLNGEIKTEVGEISLGNNARTSRLIGFSEINLGDNATIGEQLESEEGGIKAGNDLTAPHVMAKKDIKIGNNAQLDYFICSEEGNIKAGNNLHAHSIKAGGNVTIGSTEGLKEITFAPPQNSKSKHRTLTLNEIPKHRINVNLNGAKTLTVRVPDTTHSTVLDKFNFYDYGSKYINPYSEYEKSPINVETFKKKDYQSEITEEKLISPKDYHKKNYKILNKYDLGFEPLIESEHYNDKLDGKLNN